MTNETPTLGICLEEFEYPCPAQVFPLTSHLQPLKMAYMNVPPGKEPNEKTVVLFQRAFADRAADFRRDVGVEGAFA